MKRTGYTLIEVSLVLVISSVMLIAFVATVGSSLANRRYSDSAQNFGEFLRSVYSSVIRVQNNGSGNSDQAIYGKLVTFGEQGNDTVYAYDIIGKAVSGEALSSGLGILAALQYVDANVFNTAGDIVNQETYNLPHGAWLETTAPRNDKGRGEAFTGALLIARSPVSGTITTMYRKHSINIQGVSDKSAANNPLRVAINQSVSPSADPGDVFQITTVNICVASEDQPNNNTRQNIRLAAGGNGPSAISIISQEDADNLCLE